MVNEEGFIQTANADYEKTQRKKQEYEKELAKCNVNDQEITAQNIQLDNEIKQLQQTMANDKTKLDAEKTKYRQSVEQVSDNERKVKKLETRVSKVQDTITTLEENIQSELNSYVYLKFVEHFVNYAL